MELAEQDIFVKLFLETFLYFFTYFCAREGSNRFFEKKLPPIFEIFFLSVRIRKR